jgi:hydroxymethylpyrimidine pyrophosphatase-like HAD family hydrolase
MRYHVLACDYDGTVASGGRLLDDTRAVLESVRATGRKLVLVTGRQVEDLQLVCPDLTPFEVVVGENGAVLYWPATRELRTLADPPPRELVDTLKHRQLPSLAFGHVIVATWQPHEVELVEVVRELGLEMQVIFNKGAVMMLPSGVNKGTGLKAALEAMRVSPHNVVGVGDAENDHALLAACECGVAVANALPMLRERADWVTTATNGAGVMELGERLIANDLSDLAPRLRRHDLEIGVDERGETVTLPAYGARVMLAGSSGGGKSTLATAFLEKLEERAYQYCLLDPEGDHQTLPGAVVVGGEHNPPPMKELEKLLDRPGENAVVALLGVPLPERPAFFDDLLPRLQSQRARSGRPHWIVVDEVHHMAPDPELRSRDGEGKPEGETEAKPEDKPEAKPAGEATAPGDLPNLVMITVHPAHVSSPLLDQVDVVLVTGVAPQETLDEMAGALGVAAPRVVGPVLERGEALLWRPRHDQATTRFRFFAPKSERKRHIRKYAEGELKPDRSFYFRGEDGKLNLRAWNLMSFLQIGDGVDDDTWLFHLRAGDYSGWIARVVKDDALANEVAAVERSAGRMPPSESRRKVRDAIERHYTAPA